MRGRCSRQPRRPAREVAPLSPKPTYTEDRETEAKTPAATALLGDKLPTKPECTADRVRASLILCPPR